MDRKENIEKVRRRSKPWDIAIIGGGASGVGCAVDAASRGFDVLLLEQSDFGKGTSSRSTKLVHGGVRYLAQGDIPLVREALKERGILQQNAPHIVKTQSFIVPCHSLWQKFYYGSGLKLYNFLSGKYGFGKSRILSKKETIERLPNISAKSLTGGIVYYDGQFDDTRLLIDLAKTASEKGACLLNYARVFGLSKSAEEKIDSVEFECTESGEIFSASAKIVINATGAFTDSIRKLSDKSAKDIISPSQGIHLVFDESLLGAKDAIMIPKTSDGRVLFAIPWHGKTLVGTTDTQIENANLEPKPLEEEIEFVLKTCAQYLAKPPKREDVLSVFVGIRPLVKASDAKNTAKLSRDHTIEIDESNLITLTGGKWTTYRNMAEDAINKAIEFGGLQDIECKTVNLKVEDGSSSEVELLLKKTPELAKEVHPDFSYTKADLINAVRNEMARTVEDVLARRTRILFLDAKAALAISRDVAEIMAKELDNDEKWIEEQLTEFESLAQTYLL